MKLLLDSARTARTQGWCGLADSAPLPFRGAPPQERYARRVGSGFGHPRGRRSRVRVHIAGYFGLGRPVGLGFRSGRDRRAARLPPPRAPDARPAAPPYPLPKPHLHGDEPRDFLALRGDERGPGLIIIFVQQVAGYSPIGTGLAVIPITGLMFLLSTRFGALSDWSTRRYSLRRGKEDVRALLGQHSAASRPDAPARSSYHRHAPA